MPASRAASGARHRRSAGEPLGALTGATAAIRALAFSRDATRLAGTGVDGTLVWDLRP